MSGDRMMVRGRVVAVEHWTDGTVAEIDNMAARRIVVTSNGVRLPSWLLSRRVQIEGRFSSPQGGRVFVVSACWVIDDEGVATPVECEPC